MTDSLKKAAEIVAILLVIALLFFIVKGAISKAERAANDAFNTLDQASIDTYVSKNGEHLTGSVVLNFITDKEAVDDSIYILVKTSKNANGQFYVYDKNDLSTKITAQKEADNKKLAKTKSNANYINPTSMFDVSLQYNDDSGLLEGITFTEIK